MEHRLYVTASYPGKTTSNKRGRYVSCNSDTIAELLEQLERVLVAIEIVEEVVLGKQYAKAKWQAARTKAYYDGRYLIVRGPDYNAVTTLALNIVTGCGQGIDIPERVRE